MNRTLIKILALVGGIAILGGAVLGGLQLWGSESVKPSNWIHSFLDKGSDENDESGKNEDVVPLDLCAIEIESIRTSAPMSLSVAALSDDNELSVVSKVITATVSTLVEDPKLDWSAIREDGTIASEISVTPESDGAFTATVTCNSSFEGIIYVKAEIRGLGVYGLARVTFTGIPTEISTSSADMTLSNGMYKVESTGEFAVNIELSNAFGQVGEKYKDFEIVSVEKFGSFNVQDYQNGMLGTLPQGSPHPIDFADLTQEYITFSVSESVVKVNVTGSIASYYTSSYSDVGGIAVVNITKYSSGASSCGYAVTVREALSGVETTFKVTWSDVMLSTVTLNVGHIEF